jgi:hypothetical protein
VEEGVLLFWARIVRSSVEIQRRIGSIHPANGEALNMLTFEASVRVMYICGE